MKIDKSSIHVLSFVCIFILILSGCYHDPYAQRSEIQELQQQSKLTEEGHKDISQAQSKDSYSSSTFYDDSQVKEEYSFIPEAEKTHVMGDEGLSWEDFHTGFISGTLIYTFNKAWIVDNAKDIPGGADNLNCFDGKNATIQFYNNNLQTNDYYPNFVLQDGSFDHGAKLVLLSVTVENIDAISDDAVRHGWDPFLFRASLICKLRDPSDYDRNMPPEQREYGEGPYGRIYDLNFFAESGDIDEHPFFYYLPPGESRDLTLGYFICAHQFDQNPVNIKDLIGIDRGLEKTVEINLGLE